MKVVESPTNPKLKNSFIRADKLHKKDIIELIKN